MYRSQAVAEFWLNLRGLFFSPAFAARSPGYEYVRIRTDKHIKYVTVNWAEHSRIIKIL